VTGTPRHPVVTHPDWLNRLGLVNGPQLLSWRVIKLIPAVAFTKHRGNVVGALWKIVLFVGAVEALAGTRRALAAFVATSVAGYLVAYLAIARPPAALGHAWGRIWFHAGDLGSSAGCYGAGIVLAHLLPAPWRWLTLGGPLLSVLTTLHPDRAPSIWDVEHARALACGLRLGVWWRRSAPVARGVALALQPGPS